MKDYRLEPIGMLARLKLGDEVDGRPAPREIAIRIRAHRYADRTSVMR
jgi:hypothetical protein